MSTQFLPCEETLQAILDGLLLFRSLARRYSQSLDLASGFLLHRSPRATLATLRTRLSTEPQYRWIIICSVSRSKKVYVAGSFAPEVVVGTSHGDVDVKGILKNLKTKDRPPAEQNEYQDFEKKLHNTL